MPVNKYRQFGSSEYSSKSILATSGGMRSPIHVTIEPDTVTGWLDPQEGYVKTLEPGYFFGRLIGDTSGLARPLPRTYVMSTMGSEIKVQDARVFVPGITLTALDTGEPVGTITAVDPAKNSLILSAPAPSTITPKTRIGLKDVTPLGMMVVGIDLQEDPLEQGLYVSATCYKQMRPYWDFELEEKFREIVWI